MEHCLKIIHYVLKWYNVSKMDNVPKLGNVLKMDSVSKLDSVLKIDTYVQKLDTLTLSLFIGDLGYIDKISLK